MSRTTLSFGDTKINNACAHIQREGNRNRLDYNMYLCYNMLGLTVCMCAKSLQSCPALCIPMDYSPPGSSLPGILQIRILEWAAMSSSRDLPDPGSEPASLTPPALADGFFTTSATWEAH